MKDPHAVEKSKAQMDALLSVVEGKRDLLITMVTGGGKSIIYPLAIYYLKHNTFFLSFGLINGFRASLGFHCTYFYKIWWSET